MTDRRRLQEDMIAAQRREALGVMAGGIAHDFNNMLYVILGRSELALRKAGEGSPLARDLAEIREAARRAAAVTQQILTFSRGSTGRDSPVDLVATLTEAVAMLRVTLPSTIEVRMHRDRRAHCVLGDPTQLLQIIVNLATNAAHALRDSSRGEIEFSLEAIEIGGTAQGPVLAPGAYVRLRTRDNGAGMSSEVRMRALEPYFSTRPPAEGSGLGLAVVDGIARRLGGGVRIDSEPGVGTTVDVILPAHSLGAGIAEGEAEDLPGGHETILLVDDEPLVCRTEQQLLESLGYSVVIALDAVEGLGVLRADAGRYDIVITDQTMPKMAATVRARSPPPAARATGDRLHRTPRAPPGGARGGSRHPRLLDEAHRARAPRAHGPRGPRSRDAPAGVSPRPAAGGSRLAKLRLPRLRAAGSGTRRPLRRSAS